MSTSCKLPLSENHRTTLTIGQNWLWNGLVADIRQQAIILANAIVIGD